MLFLIGSALCGAAESMTELIVFRALQGLGGGGLMVTTMAVVGDIIAPRDRGRYQGFFGAVFGVAHEQLVASGRHQLCRLLDGWRPEEDEDLSSVLQRMVHALVLEMPEGRAASVPSR